MIFMVWFFESLLFSFFNSVTMLINQRFKLEGHLISGLRGVRGRDCFAAVFMDCGDSARRRVLGVDNVGGGDFDVLQRAFV